MHLDLPSSVRVYSDGVLYGGDMTYEQFLEVEKVLEHKEDELRRKKRSAADF